MSNKFQRISQLESAPISVAGAKTFTHQIASDAGGVDWSKSYMELEFNAKHATTGQLYTSANVVLQDDASETKLSPACVVQNVRLMHDQKGVLEEIRNVNVHNQTELYVKNSQEELVTKSREGYNTIAVDANGFGNMLFPCSDILGMGENPGVFPLDQAGGACQLRCDLEDRVQYAFSTNPVVGTDAVFVMPVANIAAPAGPVALNSIVPTQVTTADVAALLFPVGRSVSVTFTQNAVASTVSVSVLSSVVAAGVCTVTFTGNWVSQTAALTAITMTFDDVAPIACNALAFGAAQVGTQLTATGITPAAFVVGASYTSYILVTNNAAISYSTLSAVLQTAVANGTDTDLTFATNIFNIGASTANCPVKLYLNQSPLRLEFSQINLNLYRVKSPEGPYAYITHTLEKSVVPVSTQYINQHTVEGGLTGFKVMFAETDKLVSSLPLATAGSYRLTINNKDTSNRDLSLSQNGDDQAYKDRVKLFYGDKLRNLDRSVSQLGTYSHVVLPEKYASMPGDLVEVRVNSLVNTAAGLTAYLFKDKLMQL